MKKKIEDFKIEGDMMHKNSNMVWFVLLLVVSISSLLYADWRFLNTLSTELDWAEIEYPEQMSLLQEPMGDPLGSPTPPPMGTFETEIEELARSLRYDPDMIYRFVHDHIELEPRQGDIKGASMTLLDGSGGACDQASLMIALLKASGFDSARYIHGIIELTLEEISDWMGLANSDSDYIREAISGYGINFWVDTAKPQVLFLRHFWVRVNIDGTNYVFDPSMKSHQTKSGIDLSEIMQGFVSYDRESFVDYISIGSSTGFLSGAKYIQNLNTENMHQKLELYSTEFVDYIKDYHPNASFEDIFGGRIIVPLQTDILRYTSLPYQYHIFNVWDSTGKFGSDFRAWIKIKLPGVSVLTLPSSEVYGRRLTISYNSNKQPVVKLDGEIKRTGSAASQWGAEQTVTLDQKMLLVSSYPQDVSLKAGGTYAVMNSWGWVGQRIISNHNDNLQKFLNEGLENDSEPVLGTSLTIQGLNFLAQNSYYQKNILPETMDTYFFQLCTIGISGHFTSPYVDIPIVLQRYFLQSTSFDERIAMLLTSGNFASALEWAVLSQNQSGVDGVSTIRLLDQANLTGQKIYEMTKDNYNNALTHANFSNYPQSTILQLRYYFDHIGDYIRPNELLEFYQAYLPQNGHFGVCTSSDAWKGSTYLDFSTSLYTDTGTVGDTAGFIIGGSYHGGFGAHKNTTVQPQNVSSRAPTNQFTNTVQNSLHNPTAQDPIDLFSGAFLYDHDDMNVGGGAYPYSLNFKRSYSSANALNDGPMGKGWSHNYEITARKSSNGSKAMGSDSPVDAAAAIVATYINYDLLKNRTLENFVISAMTTKWLMDQMIDNVVTVSQPGSSMVFNKLPDGTYNPPPGKSGELTLTGDRYHLRDKKGNQVQFNEAGLIEQWSDPVGKKVFLHYNTEVSKLLKVFNDYDYDLNFVYTDGGSGPYVDSINDGKGRSVSFTRNANDELTGYTDPEGNTTVYVYDPERKAHMTQIYYPTFPDDPFVTNVYNRLGQVTTQTNAEDQTYHYYYSGYRSEEVNPLGDSMIHYFGKNGLVSAIEDQMGNITRTLYDGQRRKIMDISPEGSAVRYRYDANHNIIETVGTAGPENYDPDSGLENLIAVDSFLHFNGEDDFIDIPASSPSTLNFDTSDFSLSCWIKPVSLTQQGLISKRSSSVGYELVLNPSGTITAFIGDGSNVVEIETTQMIEVDEWTHIAASFNRTGQCTVYINGTSAGSAAIDACNGSVSNESSLYIGRLSSGTSHFQGALSDVSVWNSVRSQQDINDEIDFGLSGTESGLVGYWELDESAGMTVYDSTLIGNNHGTSSRNLNLLRTTEAGEFCYVERFTYDDIYNNILSHTDNAGNLTRYYYENSVFPSYVSKVEHPEIDGTIPTTLYEYYEVQSNIGSYGQIKTTQKVVKDVITENFYEDIVSEFLYNESGQNSIGSLRKTVVDTTGLQITTETTYDQFGNITSVTDAKGNTTTFDVYDNNRNLTQKTSVIGHETLYGYDALGRLVKTHVQTDHRECPWLTTESVYTLSGKVWKVLTPKDDGATSLEFDEAGNRVDLSYGTTTLPINNFTISAWVKPSGQINNGQVTESNSGTAGRTGQKYLFWPTYYAGTKAGMGVSVGTDGISVYEHGYNYMPPLAVYTGNVGLDWSHIAIVYENKQPTIYLNGILVHTGLVSTKTTVEAPANIGGGHYSNYSGHFEGSVRSVQLWDRALTNQEVEDNASGIVAETGLMGDWGLGEGYGTIVFDSSGNGHQGAIAGATWASDVLVTEYVYDELDRVKEVIDANGNRTQTEYYPNGRVWKQIDAEDNVEVEYTYTPNGNVQSVKDANGNVTQYTYDGFGRLTNTHYEDNTSEVLMYDDLGRLSKKTTRSDQDILFGYDAIGRLKTKQTPEDTIEYTYDILGRTDSVANSTGVIDYGYDNIGRLEQETTPGAKTVSYQYDPAGNVERLTYPDGRYVTYDYDELNRLRSISDQDRVNVVMYEYDVLSRRKRAYLGNGTVTSYEYDLIGRLKSLNNQTADKSHRFAYTYDSVGNRLSMTVSGDQLHRYGYDHKYQLTSVDYPDDYFVETIQYDYDPAGNRENDSLGTTYQPNNLNQYETVDAVTLTYDLNGNLTSDPETSATYIYDSENRLVSAVTQTHTTSYAYDALGRRFSKTVNGAVTYYVYSGVQVIGEYDGSDFNRDTATRTFVYGPGIDEPVMMIVLPRLNINGNPEPPTMQDFQTMTATWLLQAGDVGFDARADLNHDGVVNNIDLDILARNWTVIRQQSGRFYFHADGLGSVVALSDRGGQTVEVYRYDVFGRTVVYDGDGRRPRAASAVGNPYFFTGRRLDFETGLYYYRARMVSPNLGRFLQTDPIGYADGINWYAYVGNNPVMFVDPWGLCGQQSGFWGSAWNEAKGIGRGISHGLDNFNNAVTLGLYDKMGWTATPLEQRRTEGGAFQQVSENYAALSSAAFYSAAGVGAVKYAYGAVSSGFAADASTGGKGTSSFGKLVSDAQKMYPNKAGKMEYHHITPKYLGGLKNGSKVQLDGAYHQRITNEFRNQWPYGKPKPNIEELQKIMQDVYEQFPLPSN